MKIESTATILSFDPFTVDTGDSSHNLGEEVRVADGRAFRYGKAASTVSVGKLNQAPAPIANHVNMATAAAALGATSVTVTPGATGGAANIYAEGYLVVSDAAGEGRTYKIKGHPAITASTAFTVDLFDPISGVALTSASETSLVHNAYNAHVEATVTTTRGSGVSLVTQAADDFGWLQTRGVVSGLCGTAVTLGAPLVAESSGKFNDQADILGASSENTVAWATIMAGVATEYRPVYLMIA